jgi:hypothetical protein
MAWLPDTARVTHVYSDACHSAGALEPIDGTLQGLVDALDAQVSTDATISDVTIGGRAAKRIDLVASEGLDRADCRHGADGPLQVWADVAETSFYALYPTNSGFVHAMDIDGEIVVFAAATRSDATAADIAELEAIVASVAIGP